MNFIKIFFSLLLLNITLFAANVDEYAKEMGFERDYETALAKSKESHKVLVMVLGADYCPWCRKFENKTLSSLLVKPRLDKEFVVLIVDKKFDIETFPTRYRTSFTPRVFMINPNDESTLLESAGYVKKKKFMQSLDKAQKLYKASK